MILTSLFPFPSSDLVTARLLSTFIAYTRNATAQRLATPNTVVTAIFIAPEKAVGDGVGLFVLGAFGAREGVGADGAEGGDTDGAADGSRVTGVTGGSVDDESW